MALDSPDPAQARIGSEIRRRRKDRGITIIQLATEAGISHPFLSQLERGYARPSMQTLERIASALDTTQVNLMLAGNPPRTSARQTAELPTGVQLVRNETGTALPLTQQSRNNGHSRLLVEHEAAFYPQSCIISATTFGDYYQHDQHEWVHVVTGEIEVNLGTDHYATLCEGDSLYYAGGIPHRWRASNGQPARLIIVQAAE